MLLRIILALFAFDCSVPLPLIAQESAGEVVAAQIRSQGYVCDKPITAERLSQQSRPEEAEWLLQCKDAAYRVRLIPHMAALVEVITKQR